MKKFTHLLMMLCVFAGTAWAGPTDLPEITTDLENPIYYTIYNTRSTQPGGLMYYAGDGVGMKDGCTSPTLEDKYKFYFTGSHDALYVHNAATTKKLASVSSWSDEGIEWAVGVSPKGGGLAFGPKEGLNGNGCWNEKNYSTDANTSDFTTWSANDDGSIFVVELASEYTFPETGKFYTIECPLFERVQDVKKGLYVNENGALAWGNVDLTNKNHYWVPTVDAGKNTVVLKNLGTGKYLNGTEMADAEVEATLKALSSTQFNIVVNGTTLHANNHSNGNGAGSNIVSWGGSANSASAWTFVEQADPDAAIPVTIKYSFTYNGVEKYTQETSTLVGQDYPAITTTFPFGVSAAAKPEGAIPNEGIEEGVKTVEIALSVNLPFAYAPDVESIEKWQYIQMHSNFKRFLKYESNYISWSEADVNLPELGKTDAYAWTFVGNPFEGFKMLNKAATTAKALKSTNSGNPAMANYADATIFLAAASNQDGTGYFCMKYPDGNYLNAQSGKVAHWSVNDAGSTMVVNGDFVEITLAEYLADLQTLISNAEEFVTTNDANKSKVGYYKLTDIQAQIDNAKNYTESESMDDVDIAFLDLQDVMNNPEVNLPVDGRFYRIENNNASGYLSSGTGTGRTQFVAGIGEQASSIFCYTGGKLLSYTTGLYLAHKTDDNMLGYTDTVGEAAGTTIGFAKSPVLGKLLISFNNGNRSFYSNAAGESNGAGAGQTGEHYRFTVTEVESLPIAISAAGYATFYCPVAVTLPGGLEAYCVGETTNNSAKMTLIEGVIPANTGVILKGNEGTYDLTITTETSVASVETNLLTGTVASAYVGEDSYVLSKQTEGVGFYKAMKNFVNNEGAWTKADDGTHFLNNGFKAYLPANAVTTAEARFLVFNFGDDNATAIEGVEAESTANAVVYDLAGRRVQKAQKGVFIVNGKVVIK